MDGQAFGPGETVALSPEDAARLIDLGFVRVASVAPGGALARDEEATASSEPPAGASVQVQDGAQIIQGG